MKKCPACYAELSYSDLLQINRSTVCKACSKKLVPTTKSRRMQGLLLIGSVGAAYLIGEVVNADSGASLVLLAVALVAAYLASPAVVSLQESE
ncbi:hypothetical protein ACFO4L_00825 [Bacillus daqingensis]|uniref:Cxxc_20_cxxc protein n=2 Tax=Bacillus daqingensis TaxID=872396 RepID=A0ABV9NP05_9BACI